jgi:hypothetical protein
MPADGGREVRVLTKPMKRVLEAALCGFFVYSNEVLVALNKVFH